MFTKMWMVPTLLYLDQSYFLSSRIACLFTLCSIFKMGAHMLLFLLEAEEFVYCTVFPGVTHDYPEAESVGILTKFRFPSWVICILN